MIIAYILMLHTKSKKSYFMAYDLQYKKYKASHMLN
ncbi:hypothetical protein GGR07_002550 [Bacteroides pyogenes]|nr:hypothetical protein [Bacteroides pyogenes]SUV34780.1 Uncharacterised protein [Bacteroides pyogenes]